MARLEEAKALTLGAFNDSGHTAAFHRHSAIRTSHAPGDT